MKSIVVLLLVFELIVLSESTDSEPFQARLDQISKESYNRVAALVVSSFSERCKLGLQNCVFQTQWDHLFAKKKTFSSDLNYETRKANKINTEITSANETSTYHVCKAYIIAKFCIDDYLLKSEDYVECLNETNGNKPNEFKSSLDQMKECRDEYSFYLSSSSSISRFHIIDLALNILLIVIILLLSC
jgi:hypothetical protein